MCPCFKSCPRVGGILVGGRRQAGDIQVSSRAPVWGASGTLLINAEHISVSSRAPVWGASQVYEVIR